MKEEKNSKEKRETKKTVKKNDVAKEKKKTNKSKKETRNNELNKNEKVEKEIKFSKFKNVLKRKEIWGSAIVGLIIGALIVYLLLVVIFPKVKVEAVVTSNETLVTFKDGKVTKNQLYEEMRKYYPVSYVLELVDAPILEKMYDLTDEEQEEITEQADSILNLYKTYYGYTEEEFLSENGFETKEDFITYLELDYRRNLYCIDYFKTLLDEEDIQNYYDESVYGEITTKHILVEVSDDVTEKEALATANEIIAKLNDGTSFDDVAEEYADKITTEEVSFDNFEASSYEDSYIEASIELDVDTYTTKAVETSYGYHIIYCVSKEDKPSFEEVENDIVELLAEDLEEEDSYIRYKALIKLREDNNLKFKDKKLQEAYEEYCEEVGYEEETDENTDIETVENNVTVVE